VSGDTARLPAEVEVTLFRGLQETLLNVRKHAQAANVHVTLSYLGDTVALDVRDDGRGFTDGTVANHGDLTGGQGLRALRHRTEALGGELTIETTSTGGSAVSLQLPAVAS
jgi:signal transduction histidine kinase